MGKKISNKDLAKENFIVMAENLRKNLAIRKHKIQLSRVPNVNGLTLEFINEAKQKGILLNRDRLDYEDLSGTKISFKCCKTLEDGVGWYADQFPELPNDIYYYLTRTTMGFPVTPEEISKNRKLRKRFLRKKLKAKAKQYTKKRGDFTVKFK